METDADSGGYSAIAPVIDELNARLAEVSLTNIGFPAASDIDFAPLASLFDRHLLNNLGDPFTDGAYPQNTKAFEREVVDQIADLMRAPATDRWGYVTTGASEGNLFGLLQARGLHPGAMVYYSQASHYSVDKAVDVLGLPSITVRADSMGRMDMHDLVAQVGRHRERPVIVVANIGTTMTEAVDDVRRINQVLDSLAIRRRFIHADAALAGIPLALTDPDTRPGFDFADGADSIVVSGHKFLGTPVPCGVVVARASYRAELTRSGEYTGSRDLTITGSRSGHAALLLWYVLRRYGLEGLRRRAEAARELAAYTHRELVEMGWEAWYNPLAFTVVLATPPRPVCDRWTLASSNGISHIICMPGVSRTQIDEFLGDLRAAMPAPKLASMRAQRRATGLRRTTAPVHVA